MRTKAVSWARQEVNIPGIAFKDYETETAFQVACADWLRKQGYKFWHHSANEREGACAGFIAKMMGQSKGFPDIVHLGMRVAIELKLPGKKARVEQDLWLEHLNSYGWTTEVVYSFERFKELVLEAVQADKHRQP